MTKIEQQFSQQQFGNGYELIDGVKMNAELGDRFQIPHPILKRHVDVGHFVELRIDSPRFSAHPDAPESCTCPHCNEEATNPILCHEHPASLVPLPPQDVPSRGWGEQFWVRVSARDGEYLQAVIDNPLPESRLHGLDSGSDIFIHENHILAVHGLHREELLQGMTESEVAELYRWYQSQQS